MESADDVLTDAFTRLIRLVNGADKTKTLQYLVFMVSCPVADFVARALSALVELSAQASCRAQLVAEQDRRDLERMRQSMKGGYVRYP